MSPHPTPCTPHSKRQGSPPRTAPSPQIRVARAFAAAPPRQLLLRLRLLSFYVAFQSNPSPTDIMALFQAAPEFVQQVGASRSCGAGV